MIVISVAHTQLAQGAKTAGGLYEYVVSQRASRACFDALFDAGVPAALVEVGYLTREGCMPVKQRFCRDATLAVELHFNSSVSPVPHYAEVIAYPGSKIGRAAGQAVSLAIAEGFRAIPQIAGPVHPVREDGGLFFLKGRAPAIIIEGVFGSHPAQAAWLESDDGPEQYGILVAKGLQKWWISSR